MEAGATPSSRDDASRREVLLRVTLLERLLVARPAGDQEPARRLGVLEIVVETVAGRPALVILDSDHSQAHVEAELDAYSPLVPPGGYVIVEDSNIGEVREDLMPGPLQAIDAFLARTDTFEVDPSREKFMITFNPRGYLRRVLAVRHQPEPTRSPRLALWSATRGRRCRRRQHPQRDERGARGGLA